MSRPVCLLVCTGKDCRRADGYDELVDLAVEVTNARGVPCQDLCHSPVVGVAIGDSVRWYEKVRKGRLRAAVLRSVRRGTFDGELADQEVRKRRDDMRKARKSRPLRAA